jgi:HAMP domain-containing protein
VANPYSIHLVEPLSPEVAQRVATETASQLGGTPDKLAQLLTRTSGSRIARASSAAQADRVANILRKAGVSVQVVDPETIETVIPAAQNQAVASSLPVGEFSSASTNAADSGSPKVQPTQVEVVPSPTAPSSNYDVNAGSSSMTSGGTPIVPDEIIPIDDAPYKPPTRNPTPVPDPFPSLNSNAPGTDPFATDSKDLFSPEASRFNPPSSSDPFGSANVPFSPPSNDPFAAPASGAFHATNDPFAEPAGNPFAEPASNDPFATPINDPFAAPKNDPFAAPKADRFATTGNRDPFAPVAGVAETPETPAAFDPFARSGGSNNNDLPTQALRAQNRGARRTSVRAQLLSSILLPILLVGVGIMLFLAYQLNIIYRDQLKVRAIQASATIAAEQTPFFDKLPDPAALASINTGARAFFQLIPEAELTFFESGDPKLVSMTQLSTQTRSEMSNAIKQDISQKMNVLEGGSGGFSSNGIDYIGAITTMKREDGTVIGDIHVAFNTAKITTDVLNAIVPLVLALLIVTLFAIVLANTLASRLVRPIAAAAEQANRISLGDLDRSVEVQSNDEIGDLLGSLERMRVSLKSVIGRLRRDR